MLIVNKQFHLLNKFSQNM